MKPLLEYISAVINSRKLSAFINGTEVTLPTGTKIVIKVKTIGASIRPVGLRFSKYSYVTDVQAGQAVGRGFGEAEVKLLAVEKSIAEAVERAVIKSLRNTPYAAKSSNGWSAHINANLAAKSALEELLERDAILVHWLCKKPMIEIDKSSFPSWLRTWEQQELSQAKEFNRLRVLVSNFGAIPTVTTILENNNKHAVMSHATASGLEDALYKALGETCRIAQIALEKTFIESSLRLSTRTEEAVIAESKLFPEDHAMVYAYHQKFPDWIFGPQQTWKASTHEWRARYSRFAQKQFQYKFHQLVQGPLAIGYCTSSKVQNLFFGRTEKAIENGLINFERLKEVMSSGEINLMPHCIA